MTPPPRAGSSLVLRASSLSGVTRAEAANWAPAWSRVFAGPCRREAKRPVSRCRGETTQREDQKRPTAPPTFVLFVVAVLLACCCSWICSSCCFCIRASCS